MKIRFLIISFAITSSTFAQKLDVGKLWEAELADDEGFRLALETAKSNRFEEPEKKDSIYQLLRSISYGDSIKTVLAHYVYAVFEQTSSNINSAISHLDTALLNTESDFLNAKFLIKQGELYGVINKGPEGISCLQKAERLAENLKSDLILCDVLVSQAEIHRKIGDFDGAKARLLRASEIEEREGYNNLTRVRTLDRFASIYSMRGLSDTAMNYSYRALSLAKELNDLHSIAVSHNELGYLYEHDNEIDSAIHHYSKAIEIWTGLNTPVYTSNALSNMGRLHQRRGEFDEALKFLLVADQITRGRDWYPTQKEIYNMLSVIYWHKGDSVGYYAYQSKGHLAELSMRERASSDQILGLEKQFEQSENLRIIDKQDAELEIRKAEIFLKDEQANRFRFYLGLSIVGMLGILLWLRQTIRNRKRIAVVNDELEVALEIKNGLLKEIHHRVKNNLQMISGLLTIQAKNTMDEGAKQALLESKARLKSMSLVHKRLYVGEGYNEVDISSFLRDIVASFIDSADRSQDIFNLVYDDFKVHIEEAVPLGFILHELISNSFKHAWNEGDNKKIEVKMRESEGILYVRFTDNGKGVSEEFDMEKSNSLGLKLTKLFIVDQLKGKYDFEGVNGVAVDFSFPLRSHRNEV